ncbi:MAG: hypothetical protein NC098_09320 [Lachnoclostridium sp.]|nr:hypothetical protein [Lachnoclostridium sp.]
MNERLGKIFSKVEQAIHSSRGKDVLLYLLCLCVAFVFWLFMSLDTEVQRDFRVNLELQDMPDSITLINILPPYLDVSVKAKESQLLRFEWGGSSTIRFKWNDYSTESQLNITKIKLDTRLRDFFGSSVQIIACRPDSLIIPFTSSPGRRVKLNINADIHPNFQSVISGPITANVDSVTLYSTTDLPHSIQQVTTEPLVRSGMKDTVRYEVKIQPVAGARIVPDKVIVTVPVEPLISKKISLSVIPSDLPDGTHIITFPPKVEVSYLVPMSQYSTDFNIKAYVNYNDITRASNKLPITLSTLPQSLSSITITPDSVEYIIEHNVN